MTVTLIHPVKRNKQSIYRKFDYARLGLAMTSKQISKIHSTFLVILLSFSALQLSSCKGGACAATDSALEDADSDCVADTGDNCGLLYNPDQFDGDEDGVGAACDADDTNDAVANITVVAASISTSENFPASYLFSSQSPSQTMTFDAGVTNCLYYIIGCDDQFLGYLNGDAADINSIADSSGEFGSNSSDQSINNAMSFYGRDSTSCSAFNTEAKYPPVLYCVDSSDTSVFVGYLTENTSIADALDSCDTLGQFGLIPEACE